MYYFVIDFSVFGLACILTVVLQKVREGKVEIRQAGGVSSGSNGHKSRRVNIFLVLFCSFFLITGIVVAIPTIGMSLDWTGAQGVVSERKTWSDSDTWGYAYKIQFVEQRTGKPVNASIRLGNGQKYNVGETLPILYNPRILSLAPSSSGLIEGAIVIRDLGFYLIPLGLVGLGGIGTFFSLRRFIRARHQKPPAYPVSS